MSEPEAAAAPTGEQIEEWLVTHLADLLGVDPATVDTARPLYSYGFSSREEVMFAGDLEDWLGRELPPTLIWDHPSIAEVASFLTEGEGPAPAGA